MMRLRGMCGALLTCVAFGAQAQGSACGGCVRTRYWELSPSYWSTQDTLQPAPESAMLRNTGKPDLGVAFSGGGNRSASATIGELRGLHANGWLERVRYITAVSGGSWAALPYLYSRGTADEILGRPMAVDSATLMVPNGDLARRIVKSGVNKRALGELPNLIGALSDDDRVGLVEEAVKDLRKATRFVRGVDISEPDRRNKSYAHILGQVYLNGLVPGAATSSYAWDYASALEMSKATGIPAGEFITPPLGRPFLIVEATLVKRGDGSYPRLVPIEYTPLYTGVRQTFGTVGGSYVWPWAYDREYAAPDTPPYIRVGPGPRERRFTLADAIASSGAAPQLTLLLNAFGPSSLGSLETVAAGLFPAFNHISVHGGMPRAPSEELAHGDGGFVDNLGIMPLLARQVHNVIVFVNSMDPPTANSDLQSYFTPMDAMRDGSGDKTMNAVFGEEHYVEVLNGLDAAVATGGPAIYCGRNWKVKGTALYNSRGYDGLNICWVYNFAAPDWKEGLPSTVRAWVSPPEDQELGDYAKLLRNFPYYETFGQNKPEVIQLAPLQVNLLANLSEWTITSSTAVNAIRGAFGDDILPDPRQTPKRHPGR